MTTTSPTGTPLQIAHVQAHVLRHPIRTPVRTSFGVMHDRPAVFVEVRDRDGAVGWGEAWCNFPACGAEHRGRLVETVLAPLLVGSAFDGPAAAWRHLVERTAVLAIQSGEHGPIAQAIAGIDLALWDLSARRAGEPLWRHLGGTTDRVTVYASGINPDGCVETAQARRAQGCRAFKLKVGFGQARDLANLQAMRDALGSDVLLMVDANQAWDLDEAVGMAQRLRRFDLQWLEEPLRADRPWSQWQDLRRQSPVPLAGGENLAGEAAFDAALQARAWSVLQPDIAKWGGISGCWPVIRRAQDAGLRYCPHYLGAGIGLRASAHLLAAVGGDGMLEVDANDNPLRTALARELHRLDGAGGVTLDRGPGIGPVPPVQQMERIARG